MRMTDEGDLVYFKKRPEDEVWIKEMEENDMVGHPPYAEWFCSDHYEDAKKLKHLTIDEAMVLLQKD
jgi:hypothetical protein